MSELFKNRKCAGCATEYSSIELTTCPGCGSGLYMEIPTAQEIAEAKERKRIDEINAKNAKKIIKLDEEN